MSERSTAGPAVAPLAPVAAPEVGAVAPVALSNGLTTESVLALQQTAGNRRVVALLRAERPTLARTDTREGTGELSTRQLRQIDQQLHPTTAGGPAGTVREWDGRASQPDHVARRNELRTELTRAMTAYLDGVMPDIRQRADPAQTPRATVNEFAGAGRAAKRIVDDMFGEYASAAALTAPVRHQRTNFDFDAGTELVDRSDPAQFATNVADLAGWIAQTADDAQAAQTRHGFDKDRSDPTRAEASWLEAEVLAPFVAARRADLDLFDRWGFLDTTRRRITMVPTLASGESTAPGAGGAPSPAQRRAQWSSWQVLAHEYIHTLEHPVFEEARGDNRVLFEGFCEHFALQALRRWVPIARADRDPALRGEIEGRDVSGNLWPGFRPAWVAQPDAGEYDDYVRHTLRIRSIIGSGGENALRGAFFQGHVELIGLDLAGETLTTALDLTDQVQVPAGIPDVAALVTASGVSARDIARRNPALRNPTDPVRFGQHVVLPGCREHVIVEANEAWDVPGGAPTVETPQQIARQHGIAEADVRRANPAVNWAGLNAGDHILIPRH